MQIDRWYFDLQHEHVLGFYNVGIVRFFGLKYAFAEVTHISPEGTQHFYVDGRRGKDKAGRIKTKHAEINYDTNHWELHIKQGKLSVKGNWTIPSSFTFPLDDPIYSNDRGACEWDILSPRSKVILHRNNNPKQTTSGSGYIDHFKLTIPLWRIPFQVIRRARLYAENGDWIVLFQLKTEEQEIIKVGSPKQWVTGSKVTPSMDEGTGLRQLTWALPDDKTLQLDFIESLREAMVLSEERLSWLSEKRRNKLTNQAHEEKFRVVTEFNGTIYKGLIDEVTWGDR
jgi:hypothetical protein